MRYACPSIVERMCARRKWPWPSRSHWVSGIAITRCDRESVSPLPSSLAGRIPLPSLRWRSLLLALVYGSIRPKYLERYLLELCYRFNRRAFGAEGFNRLL